MKNFEIYKKLNWNEPEKEFNKFDNKDYAQVFWTDGSGNKHKSILVGNSVWIDKNIYTNTFEIIHRNEIEMNIVQLFVEMRENNMCSTVWNSVDTQFYEVDASFFDSSDKFYIRSFHGSFYLLLVMFQDNVRDIYIFNRESTRYSDIWSKNLLKRVENPLDK